MNNDITCAKRAVDDARWLLLIKWDALKARKEEKCWIDKNFHVISMNSFYGKIVEVVVVESL